MQRHDRPHATASPDEPTADEFLQACRSIHRCRRRAAELEEEYRALSRRLHTLTFAIRGQRGLVDRYEAIINAALGPDYSPPGVWPSRCVRARGW